MKKNNFLQFIQDSLSQKEICLAIVKNKQRVEEYKQKLKSQGFKEINKPLDVLEEIDKQAKIFIEPKIDNQKDLYDLILQYPTGQVELMDKKSFTKKTVSPKYDGSAIIILTTDKLFDNFKKNNLNLMPYLGLTFRE